MTVDQGEFRQAMSHFASGVTVVTTREDDDLVGITVSAFASLSLEPPLVLISIDHRARSHDAIAQSGMFAVNILTDQQEAVARRFASHIPDKFLPGTYWLSERGLPLLQDVLVQVECRLVNTLPGGDHTIYVGEVLSTQINDGQPLLYYHSQFGEFVPQDLLVHVVNSPGVGR
jgi:flavin reductase (DIM6/NTAB) family NADH-FMN oxidoreductase RutF